MPHPLNHQRGDSSGSQAPRPDGAGDACDASTRCCNRAPTRVDSVAIAERHAQHQRFWILWQWFWLLDTIESNCWIPHYSNYRILWLTQWTQTSTKDTCGTHLWDTGRPQGAHNAVFFERIRGALSKSVELFAVAVCKGTCWDPSVSHSMSAIEGTTTFPSIFSTCWDPSISTHSYPAWVVKNLVPNRQCSLSSPWVVETG